jgi:hypothetical protein
MASYSRHFGMAFRGNGFRELFIPTHGVHLIDGDMNPTPLKKDPIILKTTL